MVMVMLMMETDAQRSYHWESDGPRLGLTGPPSGHTQDRCTKLTVPMPKHTPTGKLSPSPVSLAPVPSPPCSDSPLSQMRSSIPVSHIRAVERVDEGAFQLPHVMQVVTQDGAGALHTTYLQCKVRHRRMGEEQRAPLGSQPISDCPSISPQNVNELNQWVSALRKASAPNPDKLASCHPGAFRSGHWTCCLQADRSGEGAGRTQTPPSTPVNHSVSHLRLGRPCNLEQVT